MDAARPPISVATATDIEAAYGTASVILPQTYRIGNVLTGDRAGCIFLGGAVDADVYDLYPM
jgi:hypothetical protein